MAKLHEILAVEKTPTAAWNLLLQETLKKFKNTATYFDGHSRKLEMIEDSAANKNAEAQEREEKPVATTVYDTLEYALDLFGKAEDVQFQKNSTNQKAVGTVMFQGKPLLENLPVDELLGLEARLAKIRELYEAIPTLDASRHWDLNRDIGQGVWETRHPEVKTKTDKTLVPVVLAPATDKHPAQVKESTKDIVVGKYTTVKRSGAATAAQKAEAIKRIDELMVEVKRARMRANETQVTDGKISHALVNLLLEPLKNHVEE